MLSLAPIPANTPVCNIYSEFTKGGHFDVLTRHAGSNAFFASSVPILATLAAPVQELFALARQAVIEPHGDLSLAVPDLRVRETAVYKTFTV